MLKRVLGLPNHRVALVDAEGFAVGEEIGLSEWIYTDESQDKPAHLSVPAEKDRTHYVTSISAGLDQFVVGFLTLRIGSSKKISWFIHGSLHLSYPAPIECIVGAPLELTFSLSDDPRKSSHLSIVLTGYTR